MQQTTIKKEITCSGVGLHSGKKIEMTLLPQPANSGVRFETGNSSHRRIIDLNPKRVVATGLATTLGDSSCRVSTVEHLLAALWGLEIDNLLIRLEGEEIPIMDGSAVDFVTLLHRVGIKELRSPRRVLRIRKKVRYEKDGKVIEAVPYNGFRVQYTINFAHKLVGEQKFTFVLDRLAFMRDIAPARTFGFFQDIEMLREKGLALGGSLENAVVLDENGVMNPEGLRFRNEFVRHKILDFIGDMALIGAPLQGAFSVYCSGHAFNNSFLRFLQEHQDDFLEEVSLQAAPPGAAAPSFLGNAVCA